jgi:protein SCO1
MKSAWLTRRHLLWMLAIAAVRPARAATPIGSSIYALSVPLTDQNGREFRLADLGGQPVLMSMFYTSCEAVCPMIFETLRLTLARLSERERARVRVVMVSFDPARDTVAVLARTAAARGAGARWTLARTSEADARQVAAVLGLQYRRLASGEFNHSSEIVLLDEQGQIAQRSALLGDVDPKLLQSLRTLAARPAAEGSGLQRSLSR